MPPKRRPLKDIAPNSSNILVAAAEDDHNDSETRSVETTPQEDRESVSIASENNGTDIKHPGNVPTQHATEPAAKRDVGKNQDWYQKFGPPDDGIGRGDGIDSGASGIIQSCPKRQAWVQWYEKYGDGTRKFYQISLSIPLKPSSAADNEYLPHTEICCGDTVELNNGAFIRVRRSSQPHHFSGYLFERNTRLMGWLPRVENEVFWLWTFRKGDPKTAKPPIVMAQKCEVRRKWNLRMARPGASQHSSLRDKPSSLGQTQNIISDRGTLICRWKYVRVTENKIHRKLYNDTHFNYGMYEEKSLIAITTTEVHEDFNFSYRHSFYEESSSNSVSQGDDTHVKKHVTKSLDEVMDKYPETLFTNPGRSRRVDNALRKYTFGDAFSGCGGMTRGAEKAGFKVQWGFDLNNTAIGSYKKNFPRAVAWPARADEFVSLRADEMKVDVLHVSPPCQPFSSAHKAKGKNDDPNSASLFAIPELLKITNPRVVTIEEVMNIMAGHPAYFSALVQFFTCIGYNIRWKVINCVDFGVAQISRRRLFVIASRPGTDFPIFPSRTHADPRSLSHGKLPPWRTVADAIGNIPSDCSENTLPKFTIREGWKKYDANKPHHKTVIAHDNGSICNPDGVHPLTIRELACLQSFPIRHQFDGGRGAKWAQIGNAVPPLMGQAILKMVRRALRRTDGYSDEDREASDVDSADDSDEDNEATVLEDVFEEDDAVDLDKDNEATEEDDNADLDEDYQDHNVGLPDHTSNENKSAHLNE